MKEVLIVLNNYFHDFAISLVALAALVCLMMANRAERNGSSEVKGLFLFIYPRLFKVLAVSTFFVIVAAAVRVLTLSEFEWADATRNGQTLALKVKYVMLFLIFLSGSYLWRASNKKAKKIKKSLETFHKMG
jgi:hypothetical protein